MRFDFALLSTLLLTSAAASVIDPAVAQARRDEASRIDEHSSESPDDGVSGDISELWKRRGGGGGGGRGGGGGGRGGGTHSGGNSRGGSRGGSRGSSSGGRGSSGGSSGGSRGSGQGYNTKSDSNVGGYSKLGSGPVPSFGGGKFYGGGAKVPYASGNRSPGGSIKPAFFGGAALGFWPGYWVAGAYAYSYSNHHHYYNKTSKKDEDHPVICGCAEKEVCSCEEIEDNDYWEDILKDGDYSKLNKSVVDITKVNGTTTILLNGTLPKGTTLKSDDEDDWAEYVENAAAVLGVVGLWPAVAAVGAAVLIV